MSIFSAIKNAIFGHKPAAPAPAPTAAPQAPPIAAPAAPAAAAPTPAPAPAAPPAAPVDVEAVLTDLAAKSGQPLNWRTSIVDLLKLLDLDSSLAARKELADEVGYAGPKDGSAEMNIALHKAVMAKLAANGGKVPADLTD
jgi:3-oxoacyl-ACP reductase-like protein